MSAWLKIVKTAVIGLERRTLPEFESSDRLCGLINQLAGGEPEGALLNAAAAASIYDRAGRLAVKESRPLPEPCALSDLPRITSRAALRLRSILNGQYPEVLEEWLLAATENGWRASEELLPALLDLGRSKRELCEAIKPVLGERGIWLARQNPDWDYTIETNDETTWETGSRAQRLEYLKKLRSQNAALARELLAATWPSESADIRLDLLGALSCGLSPDDESFLEAVLDDKRKEVRRRAADLLASLPFSGLCRRMTTRLDLLLEYKNRALGRDVIEVVLPVECDKSMLRDGIEPKPPQAQIGERSWWLQQMLAAVPPSYWSQRWSRSPADLVKAAGRGEWRELLLMAWAAASARHRDVTWLEALLDEKLREPTAVGVPELFQALSPGMQGTYCLKVARRNTSLNPDQPLHWLLNCYRSQWSEELSRIMMQSLVKHCAQRGFQNAPQDVWAWNGLLTISGRYFNVSLADEATALISSAIADPAESLPSIERFLDLIQFRSEMIKAFSS
jgi:hypothetical protein